MKSGKQLVPRLGVNIDHVATIRQARGETYPEVDLAARAGLEAGAEQITIHLREDRRHIQDSDLPQVKAVTQEYGRLLNLEMGTYPEIVQQAIDLAPDWVCLVPEKREEVTTEGGLNLVDPVVFGRAQDAIELLRAHLPDLKVSLFLEAKSDVLKKALDLGADAVEIHTGEYAKSFLLGESLEQHLKKFEEACHFLEQRNIKAHAGHGLTYESVIPLLEQGLFEEYNIGHAIIAQSLFEGLGPVVKKFKKLFTTMKMRG